MDCSPPRIDVASDAKDVHEEIRRLQASINDLISIQALPVIWDGRESGHIVSTLLEVLVGVQRLDFAYARLTDSIHGSPAEFVRFTQRRPPAPPPKEIGRALDRWLTNRSANAPLAVPNPVGEGEVRIAPFRLGLMDEIGVLVAGSKRPDFPTPTETLLLRVAANQALAALQEARRLHDQQRAAEELERRVADRTAQLTAANEALRESEKKYRTLFDSIDEGFCTIELLFDQNDKPIDYRFLEVNPSFEKQSGIQNAQGRTMREIAPHHEEHWFETYGRIARTGEPVRFENQAAQLRRWYDVYAFRLGAPADRKVAILFNDITERKKAEEALRRSENYLAEAQKLSHTGSWARSIATGQITYWSDEAYRLLGFDPHLGPPQFETFLQHVHPEDQARVRNASELAAREETEYEVDYRIVHPGGHIRDIHAVGHPVFSPLGDLLEYVGTVMDVTERKRAEEALQRSEAYLADAQRLTHTGSWAWDTRTDKIIHFSEETFRIFEVDPQDGLPGLEKLMQRVHPEDRERVEAAGRKAAVEKAAQVVDYRLLLPEGRVKYIHSIRHPVLNAAGEAIEVIGTKIDMTERKKAEEALQEAQAALAHVARVTMMGEMTASIAHEVNQPLAAVVNNASACISLLPDGDPNIAEVREALTEIIGDAERASNVIARVRQLARKAPVERTPLDLRDVIAEVLALARHESAARRVTIHTELPGGLPLVVGDRVQLQQVLLNLVVNAMDAMNPVEESKRVLVIRGHRETREGRLETVVSVQDAGTGFKPEQMNRLFEAFYSTKPQGMGMGLAISRSIIQAHGGRLWAEANQGPGATFLFSLPAAPEPFGEGAPVAGNATS